MRLKRIAAGTAAAGALGFASIGIGARQAQADDWCWWGWCDVPPPGHFVPSPGHIGQWTGCRRVTGISPGSGGNNRATRDGRLALMRGGHLPCGGRETPDS
jgi:hypothetical protein